MHTIEEATVRVFDLGSVCSNPITEESPTVLPLVSSLGENCFSFQ